LPISKTGRYATCDPYFIEKYGEWRKAFEMASDNGCVVLH